MNDCVSAFVYDDRHASIDNGGCAKGRTFYVLDRTFMFKVSVQNFIKVLFHTTNVSYAVGFCRGTVQPIQLHLTRMY